MKAILLFLFPAIALVLLSQGCQSGDGSGEGSGAGTASSGPPPGTNASKHATAGGTGTPDRAGEAGLFRGRVLLQGPLPVRQKILVVKDVAVCGKINHLDDRLVVGNGGGIMNAVVSVRGVKGGKVLGTMGKKFVLDQWTCAYTPHVLLLPVGATMKIRNDDGILHNIHTFSALNKPFNVAQPKVLREIEKSFAVPERIPVKCDVHGWMSSWVIVVDHAYHAVTDEEGRFEISGIPPGRYTVECWQETLGERSAEITIDSAGGTAIHDFSYTKESTTKQLN